MADNTLKITIEAKDDASAVFLKIGDAAKTLGQTLQQTSGSELDGATASTVTLEAALERAGGAAEQLESGLAEINGEHGLAVVEAEATQLEGALAEAGTEATQLGTELGEAGNTGQVALDGAAESAMKLTDAMSTVGGQLTLIGGAMTAAVAVPMLAGTKAAWSQVDAVQKATVALRAYEQDASKVNTTLAELVAYARSDEGVLFQRQDLFGAAQGLKVAGAETKNLTEYVKIMSRAVAVGTTDWAELTQVIQRVGMTGQLAGDDFDMLTKAGFQLDSSLRNQKITWDELFAVLDRGIPQIGDNLNTIEGMTIRFRSAMRGLGMEILQVDKDTSQFIEGGLGDRLFDGLAQGADLMKSMAGAAELLGEVLAVGAAGVSAFVEGFLALPDGVQTGIFVLTGLGGAAMTATGGLLLMLPRIMATRAALLEMAAAGGLLGKIGSGGLALFGPWGLAIAGVTAAVGAGVAIWGRHRAAVEEAEQAYADLQSEIASVDQTISNMKLTDDVITAFKLEGLVKSTRAAGDMWDTELGRMEADWKSFIDSFSLGEIDASILDNPLFDNVLQKMVADGTLYQEEMDAILAGNVDLLKAHSGNVSRAMAEYYASYLPTDSDMKLIEENMGDLIDLIGKPGVDVEQVFKDWGEARKKYLEGDHPDYVGFENWWEQYKADTIEATALTNRMNSAVSGVMDTILNTARADIDSAQERKKAYEEYVQAVGDNLQALIEVVGYGDPLSRWNIDGHATEMSLLAMNTQHASTALDDVYRVVVSNTDAFASQMDGVQKWADALIGAPGQLAKLDEAYARWLQNGMDVEEAQKRWNDAQEAQVLIAESNLRVQQAVTDIQLQQAPLIAAQTDALAGYLEQLADLPAEQQLVALGWMDASEAGRAMELQTLAIAAAQGKLGADGEKIFTNMIIGAAKADPVLKAMLEDMELISVDRHGNITVNFDSVGDAKSEIMMLVESIDTLILLLDGLPPAHITVNDEASGPIADVSNALDLLNGKRAYTYIETTYVSTGKAGQYLLSSAAGGYIDKFAGGGYVELAEAGPELVHLASGGTALARDRGIYEVPYGSYVSPAPSSSGVGGGGTTFNITVNGGDAEAIKRVFIDEIVPAMVSAAEKRQLGFGELQ